MIILNYLGALIYGSSLSIVPSWIPWLNMLIASTLLSNDQTSETTMKKASFVAAAATAAAAAAAVPDVLEEVQQLIDRVLLPANKVGRSGADESASGRSDTFETNQDGECCRGNSGVALSSAFGWYLKYYCNSSVSSWNVRCTSSRTFRAILVTAAACERIERRVRAARCRTIRMWWRRATLWYGGTGSGGSGRLTDGDEWHQLAAFRPRRLCSTLVPRSLTSAKLVVTRSSPGLPSWPGIAWPTCVLWPAPRAMERRAGGTQRILRHAGPRDAGVGRIFGARAAGVCGRAFLRKRRGTTSYGSVMCCHQLTPFLEVGSEVTQTTVVMFGINEDYGMPNIYSMDTFNEMKPPSNESAYLSNASAAVYQAMVAGDSRGVWLMQGWLFLDLDFWGPDQIGAYLSSAAVPDDGLIVVDLAAEHYPLGTKQKKVWPKLLSANPPASKPIIWCALHNYGGRRTLRQLNGHYRYTVADFDSLRDPTFQAGSMMIGQA